MDGVVLEFKPSCVNGLRSALPLLESVDLAAEAVSVVIAGCREVDGCACGVEELFVFSSFLAGYDPPNFARRLFRI